MVLSRRSATSAARAPRSRGRLGSAGSRRGSSRSRSRTACGAGLIGGLVIGQVLTVVHFFPWLLSLLFGAAVGEAARRGSGGHRTPAHRGHSRARARCSARSSAGSALLGARCSRVSVRLAACSRTASRCLLGPLVARAARRGSRRGRGRRRCRSRCRPAPPRARRPPVTSRIASACSSEKPSRWMLVRRSSEMSGRCASHRSFSSRCAERRFGVRAVPARARCAFRGGSRAAGRLARRAAAAVCRACAARCAARCTSSTPSWTETRTSSGRRSASVRISSVVPALHDVDHGRRVVLGSAMRITFRPRGAYFIPGPLRPSNSGDERRGPAWRHGGAPKTAAFRRDTNTAATSQQMTRHRGTRGPDLPDPGPLPTPFATSVRALALTPTGICCVCSPLCGDCRPCSPAGSCAVGPPPSPICICRLVPPMGMLLRLRLGGLRGARDGDLEDAVAVLGRDAAASATALREHDLPLERAEGRLLADVLALPVLLVRPRACPLIVSTSSVTDTSMSSGFTPGNSARTSRSSPLRITSTVGIHATRSPSPLLVYSGMPRLENSRFMSRCTVIISLNGSHLTIAIAVTHLLLAREAAVHRMPRRIPTPRGHTPLASRRPPAQLAPRSRFVRRPQWYPSSCEQSPSPEGASVASRARTGRPHRRRHRGQRRPRRCAPSRDAAAARGHAHPAARARAHRLPARGPARAGPLRRGQPRSRSSGRRGLRARGASSGFVDRGADGELYNAAALCGNQRVLRVYRKRRLPNYGVFDEERYFEPGDGRGPRRARRRAVRHHRLRGRVGARTRRAEAAEAGAKLVLNISASPFHLAEGPRPRGDAARARARESGVWLAYCNLVGGQDELVFDGRSVVISPDGRRRRAREGLRARPARRRLRAARARGRRRARRADGRGAGGDLRRAASRPRATTCARTASPTSCSACPAASTPP